MSDREFAEELQRRVKQLRAFRREYQEAEGKARAADETAQAAHDGLKAMRKRWSEAAAEVRKMSYGDDPIDPPAEKPW